MTHLKCSMQVKKKHLLTELHDIVNVNFRWCLFGLQLSVSTALIPNTSIVQAAQHEESSIKWVEWPYKLVKRPVIPLSFLCVEVCISVTLHSEETHTPYITQLDVNNFIGRKKKQKQNNNTKLKSLSKSVQQTQKTKKSGRHFSYWETKERNQVSAHQLRLQQVKAWLYHL